MAKIVRHNVKRRGKRKIARKLRLKRNLPYKVSKVIIKKVAIPSTVAVIKIQNEAKKEIIRKGIQQAKESTSFNSNFNSFEGTATEKSEKSLNETSRTLRNSPKNLKNNVKRSKKGIKQVKQSVKGIKGSTCEVAQGGAVTKAAFQQFKRAKFIQSMTAKKTANVEGAKLGIAGSFKITKGILKGIFNIIKIGKGLTTVIVGIGGAVVALLLIIVLFGVIFTSPFGIFFPDEESTISMQEAINEVNIKYQEKINQLINTYDDGSVDLIEYSGNRMQWKYIIAVYAVKYSEEEGNVMTMDSSMVDKLAKVFFDFHDFDVTFSWQDNGHGGNLKILTVNTNTKTMAEIMDKYKFSTNDKSMVKELLNQNTNDMWIELLYNITGNGGHALLEVARSQIGTLGGQTYWSWYGYDSNSAPSDWSGCFVSWCANEIGYIDQGVFPQFSNSQSGLNWFKNNGMWQEATSAPSVGDIIFLDFNGDNIADRCGIVSGITSNNMVKYITGSKQSGDEVMESAITLSNTYGWTLGYGILPQLSGLIGDTVEEQCYNYLRATGYSELAACAVLANFHGECSCDPGIYSHDYGEAAGIMQWTGPNKTIFFNWCDNNAYDWRNLESQLYFYTYWLDDVNNGEWGRISVNRHPDFQHVYSTEEFKQLSADTYNGDIARALYEGTAMFVDDMERPLDTWGAETRRYTYAVQFYNHLCGGNVDGTTQSAWRPEYANDISTFHIN